jgi:hypothetical protein
MASVERFALALHVGEARLGDLAGAGQLRELPVAGPVEVEELADLLEREAEALAPEDQLEPRAVAPRVEPFLALADREKKLLLLVEAQGAGRHFEGIAHLAYGHRLGGHHGSLSSGSAARWKLSPHPARSDRVDVTVTSRHVGAPPAAGPVVTLRRSPCRLVRPARGDN